MILVLLMRIRVPVRRAVPQNRIKPTLPDLKAPRSYTVHKPLARGLKRCEIGIIRHIERLTHNLKRNVKEIFRRANKRSSFVCRQRLQRLVNDEEAVSCGHSC